MDQKYKKTKLYPNLDEKNFNLKISNKKEFSDTLYDGKILDVEEQANIMCNAQFELAPHQVFVRNFLSWQTPYNGLLLYHGVGTGKTCSAITLSEEYREYMKQMGITKKILIIANDNVQNNYKKELFNKSKLKEIDGRWTMDGCTGDKFLREINPLKLPGQNKKNIVLQIKKIINTYYEFMGYQSFANEIERHMKETEHLGEDVVKLKLKEEYEQRMIIIDEVQNIKIVGLDDDVEQKNKSDKMASVILKMVSIVSTKLLLLSATPMFNSPSEIIYIINLLNRNDKRATLKDSDVFDSAGNFKKSGANKKSGAELLQQSARGYISFVRGENPYQFPYRIYPSLINASGNYEHKIKKDITNTENYTPLKHVDVFMTTITGQQKKIYDGAAERLHHTPKKTGLNYTIYEPLLQMLTMVYPGEVTHGNDGFKNCLTLENQLYSYKPGVMRIFEPDKLGQYSSKIKALCDRVLNSKGVILVYSRYIETGCHSIALALESIGIRRYDGKLLEGDYPQLDALTMKPGNVEFPAYYSMITGSPEIHSDRQLSIEKATSPDNRDGRLIKVIIISEAASEGIDLKNIRQIHIINPWYNMNRNEQIIGRGIRTCSHKDLPFNQRNAEIYLYASFSGAVATADFELYQLSEKKAIQMGKVSRLLKRSAVDCILNKEQQHFTKETMDQTVRQELSTRGSNGTFKVIDYEIGDKAFSNTCDYLGSCQYKCTPEHNTFNENTDTYSETFLELNDDYIIRKIKQLYKRRYAYSKCELLAELNLVRKYSDIQIFSALQRMVDDPSEYIYDQYNREGKLVNINDYYYFHPLELENTHVSMSERRIPISVVPEKIRLTLAKNTEETTKLDSNESVKEGSLILTSMYKDYQESLRMAMKMLPYIGIKIDERTLEKIIMASFLESLHYAEMLAVANHAMKNKSEITTLVLDYFENIKFGTDQDKPYIRWVKYNDDDSATVKLLKFSGPQLREVTEIQEKKKIKSYCDKRDKTTTDRLKQLQGSHLLGFMGSKKKTNAIVFKTLDISKKRNTGETCTETTTPPSSKNKLLNIVNKTEDDIPTKGVDKFTTKIICFLLEVVLRYYDGHKDEKRWFLTPVEYILWMDERNKK